MNPVITMKRARSMFANRQTVAEAVRDFDRDTNQTVIKTPRKRVRRPLGPTFSAWARKYFAGQTQLSPKLARIVGGAS